MKIVIIGAKASGKSSIGKNLSKKLGIPFCETDSVLEEIFEQENAQRKNCKEIFELKGESEFRKLEKKAVENVVLRDWHIILCGGSTFLFPENRKLLRENSIIVFCKCDYKTLWKRIIENDSLKSGVTKNLDEEKHKNDVLFKNEIYEPFADIIINTENKSPNIIAEELKELITQEMAVRCTAANTYGEIIRITTFGESHGTAIGAVLDGIPPGIEISKADIQKELDRRKPGQSKVTTPRKEDDEVNILSGIFEGKTTGAPIALLIWNKSHDSSRYKIVKDLFRPGHADFTFFHKYGHFDYRGGGRASGRETAARVAAGSIAKKILKERGVNIIAHAIQIAGVNAKEKDFTKIEKNIVRCADEKAAVKMIEEINKAKAAADSVGGIVQLEIHGLPAGLGDPVFAKLDARLTAAIMTIGAVKGIEIGKGFDFAKMRASEANDKMKNGNFLSNNAGGLLGGISTGMPIIFKIAIKPTPTIASEQQTIDKAGKDVTVSVIGHHDPCIVPRIIPAIENMVALVVLDAWEIQKRLRREQ